MPPLLAPVITPALLSTLRNHPTLPRDTWYLIAATTLTVLNRPDEIPKVYRYAIERGSDGLADYQPDLEEQLKISRRLREALIKASAISGVPKVIGANDNARYPSVMSVRTMLTRSQTINSLLSLKEVTPPELLDDPGAPSPTGRRRDIYEVPSSEILHRGQLFFDKIYGKIAKRVMGQMDRSGTEDLGLTARLVYGHVLSNTRVLTSTETSFVMIAGLIPQDVSSLKITNYYLGKFNGLKLTNVSPGQSTAQRSSPRRIEWRCHN
jgi:hypothetical protein